VGKNQPIMPHHDIALSVRGLSKAFTIAHEQDKHTTLAEAVMHTIRNPKSAFGATKETYWALKDVSFDIHKGDVVGIIGRNGAGKSTLLKVLSRITEPTKGTIDLYGRVGSLLEVGTGFHPELTGRENIYLNGAILGMAQAEIRKQFDAIVDFSGVEKFLDTPVKRYSSGMYVRLAFAVAAHLESEILIVDEVLAVGDGDFQRKCLGKMKDVAGCGRTVLLVSHHMQSVQYLCTRCLYLDKGALLYNGGVEEAIECYSRSFANANAQAASPNRRQGSGEYRIVSALPSKEFFDCSEPIDINFELKHFHGKMMSMFMSAHIVDEMGVVVTQCDSRLVGQWYDDAPSIAGKLVVQSLWLKPGRYRVDMYVCVHGFVDIFEGACEFMISPKLPYPNTIAADGIAKGVLLSEFSWSNSGAPALEENLAAASL